MKINLGKLHPQREGTRRTVTKFLWFPLTLPISPFDNAELEVRWLMTTSWVERYYERMDGWWRKEHWIDEN